MKRLITAFLVIVMFLVCCADTQAGPTILTQKYHVEGYFTTGEETNSYNITGESPISGSVHSVYAPEDIYASSSAGLFRVSAAANDSSASLNAYGAAEGDWTFIPQTDWNQLNMQIDISNLRPVDPIKLKLEDLTAGSLICDYNTTVGLWGNPTTSFQIDPAHEYHMYAYIYSSAVYNGPWSGSIQAVIPAPGAILLGSIGVCIVDWLRRRRIL